MILEETRLKFKVGKLKVPVIITPNGDRLILKFPYNKEMISEIKCMSGARWHGYDESNPGKYWSVANDQRNLFQIDYLSGGNPYSRYDRDLVRYDSKRKLYFHQEIGTQFVLSRLQCILAYDTGVGKTLIAIEVLEELLRRKILFDRDDIVWVGPRSALIAVYSEFVKWGTKLKPKFLTYEALRSYKGKIPSAVIYDEAQKIKTPTALRSQAAKQLADQVRDKKGLDDCLVLLMSGTPAPKSPMDWFWLAETACPGFLREGNVKAFRDRLALVRTKESITGGMYPELVTWWDNENKCADCGKLEIENPDHDSQFAAMGESDYHVYKKSKNEVSYLYQRLKGLVDIVFKKDCLGLPEKVYREIECKPSESMLRMAQMIVNTAKNAVTARTLLRELSDGFQYQETKSEETEECPLCKGSRKVDIPEPGTDCPHCKSTGVVDKYLRTSQEFKSPKESVLIDLLEEYEDIGRIIIAAGFTGSIDKIINLVRKEGWHFIRVDGRGWYSDLMDYKNGVDMVTMFQEYRDLYPKVAFVTQPSSGGTGLTLTASPAVIFYSNDDNGDSRFQMEDRIHRIGLDFNLGATIIDLICLESDRKVKDNLQKKKDLQLMTLGDFQQAINIQAERIF